MISHASLFLYDYPSCDAPSTSELLSNFKLGGMRKKKPHINSDWTKIWNEAMNTDGVFYTLWFTIEIWSACSFPLDSDAELTQDLRWHVQNLQSP